MDVIAILRQHNRPWSENEIVCFMIFYSVCIGAMLWMRKNNRIKTGQMITILIEISYLAVVFASTVFTRKQRERTYELQLFWSWKYVWQYQSTEMLLDNILNIILLFPFGFFLPFIFRRKVSWREGVLCGFFVSLGIEGLQLILCRGLFEWDDMIHNAIGSMIGSRLGNKVIRCIEYNRSHY